MPYLPCAPEAVPEPYHIIRGGSPTTAVAVHALVTLHWDDGTTGSYQADVAATSAYGGLTVDATTAIYLLVAVQGRNAPVLVKERDQFALDTVLGGTPNWAVLRRMESEHLWRCRQSDGGVNLLPMAANGVLVGTRRELDIDDSPDVLVTATDDPTANAVHYALHLAARILNALLPTGHEGDVLYYHNGAWIGLPIGVPGNVLTVVGADPAWQPATSGPPTTKTVTSNSTMRVQPITVGGGGIVGWTAPTFNDSAWAFGVNATVAGFQPTIPGASAIWDTILPTIPAAAESILTRQTFALPPGTVTDATLTVTLASNGPDGGYIYVNGHLIAHHLTPTSNTDPYGPLAVDSSLLIPGGTNVVAIQAGDGTEPGPNQSYRWVEFKLVVTSSPTALADPTSGGGGVTAPDGSLLVRIGGVWSVFLPGANGTTLKMVGGLPAWA